MNPDYVVFQEIRETSKLFMRCVTAIEESWLPVLQPEYCSFSSPMELPSPCFDDITGTVKCHMTCTYGRTMSHDKYFLFIEVYLYFGN